MAAKTVLFGNTANGVVAPAGTIKLTYADFTGVEAYPTSRNGVTAGVSAGSGSPVDRAGQPDALAGVFGINSGDPGTSVEIRVDLDAAGMYDIRAAFGDPTGGVYRINAQVFDGAGTTDLLAGAVAGSVGDGSLVLLDAVGTSLSAAAWPAGNIKKSVTFAATYARIVLPRPSVGNNRIANISFTPTGAPTIASVALSPATSTQSGGVTTQTYTGTATLSDSSTRAITTADGIYAVDVGSISNSLGSFGVLTDPAQTSVIRTIHGSFTVPANSGTGQVQVVGTFTRTIPAAVPEVLDITKAITATITNTGGSAVAGCYVRVESFNSAIAVPEYQDYITNGSGQVTIKAKSISPGTTTFRVYALAKHADFPVTVTNG